jgi:2-dehydropantoate 2-reductase
MGTGAVGGYFGGRLAQAGLDVTFFARGKTLKALRKTGLRVESPLGDFTLRKVNATCQASDAGPVDLVIVAVKAWQVLEAAEALRPWVGEETVLLPLQNGVEAADQLVPLFGEDRTLAGVCRIVALQAAPSHIKHVGVEPFISLGELDNRSSRRVEKIVRSLNKAGIEAIQSPDIHAALWKKFLFVAPVGGVGAVTRAPLGEIRSVPETREMLVKAMKEVFSLALARGITLYPNAVDKTLAFLDGMPYEATSSMQRDIMEGRPSELEAMNGAVIRMGRSHQVDVPVNAFLYAALLPMEKAARPPEES